MNTKPFYRYIFEIIAIFIGITLSLLADEWREKRQNREETIEVLKMIQTDIQSDTASFNRFQKQALYYTRNYTFIASNKINTLDSLKFYYMFSEQLINPSIRKIGMASFDNIPKKVLINEGLFELLSQYYYDMHVANDIKELFQVRANIMAANKEDYLSGGDQLLKSKIFPLMEGVKIPKWELKDSTDSNIELIEKYEQSLRSLVNSDIFHSRLSLKGMAESHVNAMLWSKRDLANKLLPLIEEEISQ